MGYEGFTLDLLMQRFALSIVQDKNLFAQVKSHKASDLLTAVLKRNLPLVIGKGTKKLALNILLPPF
jgi:hypothetical protein